MVCVCFLYVTSIGGSSVDKIKYMNAVKSQSTVIPKFYSCTIESILTGCIPTWYGNCSASDRKVLQRVVRTAQYITGAKLPAIQDLCTRRCHRKAPKIVKDTSHPSHRLFSLLPHGKWYRSVKSRTKTLLNSFYTKAIRLPNN